MPINNNYHTGVRRSQTNKGVYIRSGDGVGVAYPSGWMAGGFSYNDGWDYLYWKFFDNSNKNTINDLDDSTYFICEY